MRGEEAPPQPPEEKKDAPRKSGRKREKTEKAREADAAKKAPPKPKPKAVRFHFPLLELNRGTKKAVVERAFRHKALRYHPDKKGGSEAMFKKLGGERERALKAAKG
jgi:hypothetical protein